MTNINGKKVLLLVDDAPGNIRMVDAILRDSYEILTAASGAKALEVVKTLPVPDMILLDVAMPGLDGYEVCSRLKGDPATRDIPVIFLTGQTEVVDEEKGFQVGAVDYIQKPFSEAIIKARIHTHLALRGVRKQLAQYLSTLLGDLETARCVQLSILPHEIPRIEGLDIAARYVPMAALGGDFYDFLVVDKNRIGILIADVSGHGTAAALIASMLKISFAAQAGHASRPAEVLSGINQSLIGKFKGHYVTAAYVFVDTEAQTLRYAGAGHPPLLLCGNIDRNSREILENGLILGAFPGVAYSEIELTFAPGDWMVLCTDGVTEAVNRAGLPFGMQQLKQSIGDHRATSAPALADQLLSELWQWIGRPAGNELADDVTLVALHAHSSAAQPDAACQAEKSVA